MSDQWHLLQDGQQYGPYTGEQLVEFAADGRVIRESMLWAEGMAEWVPASQVEGLFPPETAPVPVATYTPGGPPPPWMGGGTVPVAAARPVGMAGPGSTGMMAGRPRLLMHAAPGEDYPQTDTKSAWFGLLVALLAGGGGVLLLLLGLLGSGTIKLEGKAGGEHVVLLLLIIASVVAILVAWLLQLVYLARLWGALGYSNPRTTPGKAIGLMFVPLFNLYWIFVVIHGLAQDWNRITHQHPNLMHAPKLSEGMFLTYCFGCVLFPPLALALWFPLMAQICNAINFMAYRPAHHPGFFNIR